MESLESFPLIFFLFFLSFFFLYWNPKFNKEDENFEVVKKPKSKPQWIFVAKTTDFTLRTSILINDKTVKEWGEFDLPPIALFRFKKNGKIYAIQDECPHVAVGHLSKGEADEIEDFDFEKNRNKCKAAVSCPIHAFVFDLDTGACVTVDPCEDAKVFEVDVRNDEIWVKTEPKHFEESKREWIGTAEGNRMQLHLVEKALNRVYGTEEDDDFPSM
eukprot:g2391.t1